jgi:hypothetical protein
LGHIAELFDVKLAIHPICQLFPMLSEDELEGLAEDIRRRGLLESIMLLDGQVLDGRNRLEACRRAGVEPRFTEWRGEDSPLAWAISKNLRRRQFNASQRAVLALEVLPMLEKEARERLRLSAKQPGGRVAHECATLPQGDERARGRATHQAARLMGASSRYIQAAKQVRRFAPDLLVHVLAGRINLVEAQLASKLPPKMSQLVLNRLAATPRGVALNLRRIVDEELRAFAGVDFRLSDPPWVYQRSAELDLGRPADWAEHRVILWNKQLTALDNGQEIPLALAGRACLLRLNPHPTPEQIADAEGRAVD